MKIKSFVLKTWHNAEFQKHLKTFLWQTLELFVAFLIGVVTILQPEAVNPVAIIVLAGLSSLLLQASKKLNNKK